MNVKILKTNLKRTLAMFLSVIMFASIIMAMTMTALANSERFPHMIFASSPLNDAVQVNARNYFTINGNIATNGTFAKTANRPNLNGRILENVGEDVIRIDRRIVYTYFSGNNVEVHGGDFRFANHNINRNHPLQVSHSVELTGNISLNSSIMSTGDIVLNGEVVNTNNIVVFSERGDVVINNYNSVNLNNALIYAPFGDVVINSNNVNISGVIIAQRVIINAPNVNINHRASVAQFVGTESEIPDNCWLGGRIASPIAHSNANFNNGNALDGSRASLNFNVLKLIGGTDIRANDIYGIKVETWGNNTENRQVTIEVNGVSSPRFHGSSAYNPDRIWAIMSHGNTPNNGGRTRYNTLVYMNRFAGNPQVASDIVPLRPFVDTAHPERFDVRIRPNDNHASVVQSVAFLDRDGNVLGGSWFDREFGDNTWHRFVSIVDCDECKSCLSREDFIPPVEVPFSLTHEIINNGAEITGFTGTPPQNLIIPNTIAGYPVTAIGVGAFERTRITSVVLPNTVTHIRDFAFAGTHLRTLTIPNSVVSIGNATFENSRLETVTFAPPISGTIQPLNIGLAAFANTTNLTSINVPSHASIGFEAFHGSGVEARFRSVTMPFSVFDVPICGDYCSRRGLGDVNGNGGIDIGDALAVLRYLVELSSHIGVCENARHASLIVSEGNPTINDALQILRYLVDLPNAITGDYVSDEGWLWPVAGFYTVSCIFNCPRRTHNGIDIAGRYIRNSDRRIGNEPILAVRGGRVVEVDHHGNGWGQFVRIEHDNGYHTLYAHMIKNSPFEFNIHIGQRVEQGQRIGHVGNTGRSFGYHLHLEVVRNGERTDPLQFFNHLNLRDDHFCGCRLNNSPFWRN
ncbi:MAG: peptidoglycan DD-metalloendopeptidase family protein [Oscillospiraceae bacterium]|nr:peptidoglycan DD-metalloendopeptidase family protein [Oscillospiraceae bacterium]